jgi:hypothetical protein
MYVSFRLCVGKRTHTPTHVAMRCALRAPKKSAYVREENTDDMDYPVSNPSRTAGWKAENLTTSTLHLMKTYSICRRWDRDNIFAGFAVYEIAEVMFGFVMRCLIVSIQLGAGDG